MRKKYMSGRVALIAAIILWIADVLMLMPGSKGAVAAFQADKTNYPNVTVSAGGTYGIVYMNKNAKEIILENMAQKIGINRYQITSQREENIEITTLSQTGANGNVTCSIRTSETQAEDLSIRAKQEFFIKIDLINNANAADEYSQVIKEIFKQYDVKPEMSISYYD